MLLSIADAIARRKEVLNFMTQSNGLIYNLLLPLSGVLFMQNKMLFIAFSLITLLPLSAAGPDDEPLYGFTAASSRSERDWENKFRAIPDPKILRDSMQRLSARPHHVGSPYDKQNAEWILSQFKSWGLDAQIETFDVLFPTPKERVLELTEPTRFVAKLAEPPV